MLVGKLVGKETLGTPRRRLDDNIKTVLIEMRRGGCGSDSWQGQVTGCCKRGNVLLGFPTMRGISWIPDLYTSFFSHEAIPPVGQGLLIIEASRSHSDTPYSVGLIWTSDQLDAENSTWQHTTLTRGNVHVSGGIRSRNPSKQAAANPRLRRPGHWDRLCMQSLNTKLLVVIFAIA
jgi:hypothetical protein